MIRPAFIYQTETREAGRSVRHPLRHRPVRQRPRAAGPGVQGQGCTGRRRLRRDRQPLQVEGRQHRSGAAGDRRQRQRLRHRCRCLQRRPQASGRSAWSSSPTTSQPTATSTPSSSPATSTPTPRRSRSRSSRTVASSWSSPTRPTTSPTPTKACRARSTTSSATRPRWTWSTGADIWEINANESAGLPVQPLQLQPHRLLAAEPPVRDLGPQPRDHRHRCPGLHLDDVQGDPGPRHQRLPRSAAARTPATPPVLHRSPPR